MTKEWGIAFFTICAVCATINTEAHDTTHMHPLLTAEIARLIKNTDSMNAYAELYEQDSVQDPANQADQLLYWGTDFDSLGLTSTSKSPSQYLLENVTAPYSRYNNVIDGVIQEDMPAGKVKNHFQHAPTGKGLTLDAIPVGEPSSLRAMRLFNESILWMSGYEPQEEINTLGLGANVTSKQYAFFKFGQALHHVEDMSSPAHIHNDAHLTLDLLVVNLDSDKDDYEGWFLPQQKATVLGPNLGQWFVGAQTITSMSNPWDDVWDYGDANSMLKYYYDRTTYNATLEFPKSTVDPITGTIVIQNASTPLAATGELERMFPCEDEFNSNLRNENVPNCLHWEEDKLFEPAHWVINAVGEFQHQYSNGNDDAWWPVESEINFVYFGDGQNPFLQSRYYIEQLSTDNDESNPLGVAVVPIHMRTNFNNAWDKDSNPSVANTLNISEIYAKNLLSPAIEYGAGFTQYWYDVANTPPYLMAVKVNQGGKIVYTADWNNNVGYSPENITDVTTCILGGLTCGSTVEVVVSVVESRVVGIKEEMVSHISDKQSLILELEFNEPIKQITRLRIGEFNPGGGCVVVGECRDITPAAPNNGAPPANVVFDAVEGDKIWKITVPTTVLSNLNGKLQLTVKAIDKNNHSDGTDGPGGIDSGVGAELDGTPNTPARRNLSFARGGNDEPTGVNFYPWYVGDGVDIETTPDDAYSYDYADGDQNHWLAFDTGSPSAVITVNTTLPPPPVLP